MDGNNVRQIVMVGPMISTKFNEAQHDDIVWDWATSGYYPNVMARLFQGHNKVK